MKTAREIIAAQVCAELNDVAFADLPEVATYLERKTHIDRPLIDQNEALVSADAILAALAAEGLSIVETGRDPVTLNAAADYVEGTDGKIPGANVFVTLVSGNNQPCMSGDGRDRLPPHKRRDFDAAASSLADDIRSLSRSTREGKTE